MNDSDTNIIQSVIIANVATGEGANGGGVACSVSNGSRGCFLINNTIANNTSSSPGGQVFLGGYDSQVQVINNIIIDNSAQGALECDNSYSGIPSTITFNDVYNAAAGPTFMGVCASYVGSNGNISADPLFFDPANQNFHLKFSSPAIDHGSDAAPDLPTTDFDGDPRIQNGTVDMGAYEYFPAAATVAPSGRAFGNQAFGTTSSSQTVTVTNTGTNALLLDIAFRVSSRKRTTAERPLPPEQTAPST